MKKVITALTATAAISTYGLSQNASADTESSVHPVVSGDTLWSIAKSNGLTVDQLKDFNNLSSDLIRAGSQLNLSNTSSTTTTATPSTYTVKAGDTLWGIGNRHNVSVADLKEWNNLSSDLILVNQKLTLKGDAEKAEPKKAVKVAAEETEAVVEEVQESADTYTVKPGDTLYRIATEHGMTYRTLMAINGLTDYIIHPGDVLQLKGEAKTEVVVEDTAPVEEADVVEEETAAEEPAAVEAPVEETVVEEVEAEAPVQEEVNTVVEEAAPAETPAEEAVTEEVEEPAAVEAPVEETAVEAEEPAAEEAEEEVEAEAPVIEEAPAEETGVEEEEEPAVEEAPVQEEEPAEEETEEAPVQEEFDAEEPTAEEEEAEVEAEEPAEEPVVEEVETPVAEETPVQEEETEVEEEPAEEAPVVEGEPAQEEVEEDPEVEEEPAPSNITGDSYTVQSGDTLASIAKRAGMNYNDIMAYNEMDSVLIYPGLTLDLVDNRPAEPVQEEVSAPVEEEDVEETPEVVQPEPTPEPEVEEVEPEPVVEEAQEPAFQAPASPVASYGTNWYPHGECTWYAFERRKQLGKPASGSWGNAYNWASAARSQGLAVNNTPSVGAIIQTNAWSNGAHGFGHVGVVEQVNPDGSIMISEMNWSNGLGGKSFRTLSASQAANHNFIH